MLNNLTGLRGLAALWVVFYHNREYFEILFGKSSPFSVLIGRGYFGVDLFFCLSGFIMGYVYLDKFVQPSSSRLSTARVFLAKRFARIYPVYFITTLLASLMYLIAIIYDHSFSKSSSAVLSLTNLVKNLLLLQILDNSASLNYPAWSVSAEAIVYVMFPGLIYFAILQCKTVQIGFSIVLVANLVLYGFAICSELKTGFHLIQVVSEFLIGLSVYALGSKICPRIEFVLIGRSILGVVLLFSCIYLENEQILSLIVPLILVFLIFLNSKHNHRNRGLSRKFLVRIGVLSYSLYLFHGLVQQAVSGLGFAASGSSIISFCLQMACCILLPILIASVVVTYIEIPCRRFLLAKFGIFDER